MAMGHIRNESEEQIAYAKDMFETIFKDFTQEKRRTYFRTVSGFDESKTGYGGRF